MPFADLSGRIKKAKLERTSQRAAKVCSPTREKTYGIAQSLSAMVLYYRVDLFKELDIDPDSLTTWEKLVDPGKMVVEKHGKSMIALDPTYLGFLLRQRTVICLAGTARCIPTARRRSRCSAGCRNR
ncbi:MAG: hypothetical protein CM1200mP29_07160 [Verrucomicrobiota bacterium]|nr:MAG: hypothetical protein CM1200mP29_07160 [Verrucomicrobiota bacterium]